MSPYVFLSVAGTVAIVWGSIVAVKNQWAASWMSRMQSIYGKRASAMVTPGYVRFIGMFQVLAGVVFIVLALLQPFPDSSS